MHTIDHSHNVIEIKDVSFSYGETEILKNINLNIHRGDYLGIVGSNGSGKTTLLKIILGLLKPTTGHVLLFGKDSEDFKTREKIGYVPQKATHFDEGFPATVHEVVLMGRYAKKGLFGRMTQEDHRKSKEALELVGMSAYHNRLIGELSGGQQQRVFIARALAGEPEVLFLDEPTIGIDMEVKKEFYNLLRTLNEQLHLTIVLITHDIESIQHDSMHIACVNRTLFFHSSIKEYLEDAAAKKAQSLESHLATHHHGTI